MVKDYDWGGVRKVGIEVDQMMNGSRPPILPDLIEYGSIVSKELSFRAGVKKPRAILVIGRTKRAGTKVELVAALIEQALPRNVERLCSLTFCITPLVVAKNWLRRGHSRYGARDYGNENVLRSATHRRPFEIAVPLVSEEKDATQR